MSALPPHVSDELDYLVLCADIGPSDIYRQLGLSKYGIKFGTLRGHVHIRRRALAYPPRGCGRPALTRRIDHVATAIVAILANTFSLEAIEQILLRAIEIRHKNAVGKGGRS